MTSFGAVPATGGRVFVRIGAGPRVGLVTALTGASAAPRRASLAVVGGALRVGGTSWVSHVDTLPAWQKRGVGLWWERYEKLGTDPRTGATSPASRRRLREFEQLPVGIACK